MRYGRLIAGVALLVLAGCESGSDGPPQAGAPAALKALIRFADVDLSVAAIPADVASIEALAAGIQTSGTNAPERAYAIYRWIRDNIEPDEELIAAGAVTRATQTAAEVFSQRKAVCSGYTRLYKELAGRVGLQSRRITGHAVMTCYDPEVDREAYEHVWIAVAVDGAWYLIEPSWNTSQRWDGTSDPNFFFCTAPAEFASRHLPSDPDWQLLAEPVSEETFWSSATVCL